MQDIEELMQLAAGGEATAEELAALERALAGSPLLRQRYDATRALVQKLDRVPLVDPPAMDVLPLLARNRRVVRPGRRWFAVAYAAAALLVIGIAVQHAVVPPQQSGASMAPVEETIVGRASNADATAVARASGGDIVLEVTAHVPYSIDYDRDVLQQTAPGRFQRLPGAKGRTVIRLGLPNNNQLSVPVDLP